MLWRNKAPKEEKPFFRLCLYFLYIYLREISSSPVDYTHKAVAQPSTDEVSEAWDE